MISEIHLFRKLSDERKKFISIEKNKSIEEIYKISSEYNWFYKKLFNETNGYNTIGDLLLIDKDVLERKFFNDLYLDFTIMLRTQLLLKEYLRKKGLIFKFEYDKLDIKEEEASVRLRDLENFPKDILRILENKNGPYDLRIVDLLNMKFDVLCKTLGDEKIVVLKKYLHKLGFKLLDEKVLFIEVSDKYSGDSVLVQDVFDDIYTVNLLHKAEIFSLDELVNYGDNVFNLYGIGEKRKNYILYIMSKYGYSFMLEDNKVDEVKLLRTENENLKKRIFEYEQKLSEKEVLLIERKYLLEQEKELDRLITYKDTLDIMKELKYSK